jgi:hypothetical protein
MRRRLGSSILSAFRNRLAGSTGDMEPLECLQIAILEPNGVLSLLEVYQFGLSKLDGQQSLWHAAVVPWVVTFAAFLRGAKACGAEGAAS